MFFIFSGNDYSKKKIKLDSIKETLVSKRPDADFKVIDSYDIDDDLTFIKSLIDEIGLFEEKSIINFINILENKNIKKFFFNNIEKFKDSDNAFIFSEDKLTKAEFDKAKKFALKAENFDLIEKKYNLFSLTDFLGRKDKKNLWIKYNEALEFENSESIYNILMWQMKTIFLVSENEKEAQKNLKPFVLNKNKNFLKNWKKKEIEEKYIQLLEIQYKNRKFSVSLNDMLEKFILNL